MKAVVALGANIGSPREQMDVAIALLREATEVKAVSNYYVTKPVGGPEQPDYLNAVCILESELPALDLLAVLQGIEKSLGRVVIHDRGLLQSSPSDFAFRHLPSDLQSSHDHPS
jgi:2-amino-4-hydroxy-6-hydroxymethyldihydropteridine diphosphokinase